MGNLVIWHEEKGQGMVEYAVIIMVISLAALIGLGVLGTSLNNFFNSITIN